MNLGPHPGWTAYFHWVSKWMEEQESYLSTALTTNFNDLIYSQLISWENCHSQLNRNLHSSPPKALGQCNTPHLPRKCWQVDLLDNEIIHKCCVQRIFVCFTVDCNCLYSKLPGSPNDTARNLPSAQLAWSFFSASSNNNNTPIRYEYLVKVRPPCITRI